MEKIIIAADDFGINQNANNNILELARLGKIGRVAVLVDENNFSQEEISGLKNSGVRIDIHLDTHLGTLNKKRQGIFWRSFLFLIFYFKKRKNIENEWIRQMEKFKNIFGKNPDGLNSHQHIHFFPPYFKIALRLCKKYNLSYLRFGRKNIMKSFNFISWILYILRKINNRNFSAANLESSDYLISLDWIKDMEKFIANLPAGKTEIVCHPERTEEYEMIKKLF